VAGNYIAITSSDETTEGCGLIKLFVIRQHVANSMIASGRWFSPGRPASSTNKTDRHDVAEILLKVALNAITLTQFKESCYLL